MTEPSRQRIPLWPLLITLLVVLLDQVSKYLAVRYLDPAVGGQPIPLIGSFLSLTYLENSGISFGQFQNLTLPICLLTMVLTVGLFVAYRFLLSPSPWANAAVGLILGGALGNQVDRILTSLQFGLGNSFVVDFINVRYFAVFNVADSAITVGGILYGVYLVFFHRGWPAEEKPKEKDTWTSPPNPPSAT